MKKFFSAVETRRWKLLSEDKMKELNVSDNFPSNPKIGNNYNSLGYKVFFINDVYGDSKLFY